MKTENDWRLTNQERYLKAITLVHRRYRQNKENPNWDHDHCAFCWVKFSSEGIPGSIQEGYATEDGYHWICPECFADFKDRFQWAVIEALEDID